MWRSWFTEPRGRLRYQESNTRTPVVQLRLSEVLAWAERQLTPAEWARVEALVTERRAARDAADGARQEAADRTRQPRWSPARLVGLTTAEADRLAELGATQSRAERELTRTVRAALTAASRAGEQLDLFADLARSARPGDQGWIFAAASAGTLITATTTPTSTATPTNTSSPLPPARRHEPRG